MKKTLLYGIIAVLLLAAAGWLYYVIKKPNISVLDHIPHDVTYCITINKSLLLKQSGSVESLRKDSMLHKLRSRLPGTAQELFKKTGFNPLGDLALFGDEHNIHFAWTGQNKDSLDRYIAQNKIRVTHFENYSYLDLAPNLFLCYKWPVLLLKNKQPNAQEPFFYRGKKGLKKENLMHESTKDCAIFGFIHPGAVLKKKLLHLPLEGKVYAGIQLNREVIKVLMVQPSLRLSGKLGTPREKPPVNALIRWPANAEAIKNTMFVPDTVQAHLSSVITKPFSGLQLELLDTFSHSQRVITYDMDEEFKLTQKVTYVYKNYPGFHLELFKAKPEHGWVSAGTRQFNAGLDLLKLFHTELPDRYIFTSDSIRKPGPIAQWPDYYVYINFFKLSSDPFWKVYLNTYFEEMELYAQKMDQGTLFCLELRKAPEP